jgi:hypothetical protein
LSCDTIELQLHFAYFFLHGYIEEITDWRRNRDRIGRDYEGLDRYLDEFEERIEIQ